MAKMLYLFTNTPEADQAGRSEHFGLLLLLLSLLVAVYARVSNSRKEQLKIMWFITYKNFESRECKHLDYLIWTFKLTFKGQIYHKELLGTLW